MKSRIEQGIEEKINLLNEQLTGNSIDESKVEIAKVVKMWAELLRNLESDEENGVTIKRFSIDGCLSYLKGTSNSQPSFSVLVGYEDNKIDLLHNYILSRNTIECDMRSHIEEVFGISADKSTSGVHEDNGAGNPILGEEKERVVKEGPKAIDFRKLFSRAIGCEEKGKEGNLPITITKNKEGDRFIDSAPPKNGCIVLKGKAPNFKISLPEIEEIDEDGYFIEHDENDLFATIRILPDPLRVDRFCVSRPTTPEGQAGKLLYEDSDIIESYDKEGKRNIGEKIIQGIKDKVASIKFSVRGKGVDIEMQSEVANIDEVYKEILAEHLKEHQLELEAEIAVRDEELAKKDSELQKKDGIIKGLEKYYDGEDYVGRIAELEKLLKEYQEEEAEFNVAFEKDVADIRAELNESSRELQKVAEAQSIATREQDEVIERQNAYIANADAHLDKSKQELKKIKEEKANLERRYKSLEQRLGADPAVKHAAQEKHQAMPLTPGGTDLSGEKNLSRLQQELRELHEDSVTPPKSARCLFAGTAYTSESGAEESGREDSSSNDGVEKRLLKSPPKDRSIAKKPGRHPIPVSGFTGRPKGKIIL